MAERQTQSFELPPPVGGPEGLVPSSPPSRTAARARERLDVRAGRNGGPAPYHLAGKGLFGQCQSTRLRGGRFFKHAATSAKLQATPRIRKTGLIQENRINLQYLTADVPGP